MEKMSLLVNVGLFLTIGMEQSGTGSRNGSKASPRGRGAKRELKKDEKIFLCFFNFVNKLIS